MTVGVCSPSGLPIALLQDFPPERAELLVDHLDRFGELLIPRPREIAPELDLSKLCRVESWRLYETLKRTPEALEQITRRYAVADQHVVAISKQSPLLPLVALYAAGIGATLVYLDLAEPVGNLKLPLDCLSATFVCDPRLVSTEVLEWFWQIQDNSPIRIGLVPARDSEEFSRFAVKRLFAQHLYRHFRGTFVLVRDSAGGLEYQSGIVRESKFTEADVDCMQQPHQLASYEFHAKETCAKFHNHVFCGLPDCPSAKLENEVRPQCADGAPCVWTSLHRIKAARLPAAHVFAVSCGSLRVANGLFSTEFGLGMNIFRGCARSFLSPSRFVVASALHSGLLCDLAMSGERLGEIAYQINKWTKQSGTDAPPFLLLGDPNDAVDVDAALGEDLPKRQATDCALRARDIVSSPTRASPPAPMPLGLLNYVGDRCPQLHEDGDLLDAMQSIDASNGLWPSLAYSDHHKVVQSRHTCFVCAERCITYLRTASNGSWQREVVNCPRCGVIADLPVDSYESVTIDAPGTVVCGEIIRLSSSCPADTQSQSAANCRFSLIQSDTFGWPRFGHEPIVVHRGPQAFSASLETSVPATAYRFVYWVRATWLTTSGFYWVSRPMTIA